MANVITELAKAEGALLSFSLKCDFCNMKAKIASISGIIVTGKYAKLISYSLSLKK